MSVVVERDEGDEGDLATRLAKAFQQSLSLRVPVKLVEPGALPRFELKARRWIVD